MKEHIKLKTFDGEIDVYFDLVLKDTLVTAEDITITATFKLPYKNAVLLRKSGGKYKLCSKISGENKGFKIDYFRCYDDGLSNIIAGLIVEKIEQKSKML